MRGGATRVVKAVLCVVVFAASWAGTLWYVQFAERRHIVAERNFRTLHERVVPRGGGIVFAGAFILAVLASWVFGELSTTLVLMFGVGGAGAAIFGFADDLYDVRPTTKLISQACLSAWLLAAGYDSVFAPLLRGTTIVNLLVIFTVMLFVPLWMINLYNFIDGIDAMAIGGAVFICGAVVLVLTATNGDDPLMFITGLLAAATLGCLVVSRPPSIVFMGDAGSIFLGYCFGALLLITVVSGQITGWTWLSILGYFIGDTTTTTVARMFLVKKWYGAHRSHAYQNLARIYKSHAKVTSGVMLYNLLWALPLAVCSATWPDWGPAAAGLSVFPPVLWTLRFGPPLSSD